MLQVELEQAIGRHQQNACAMLIGAAAAVQGLESLTVEVDITGYGRHAVLDHDLLLPLTTAAGGPGACLKCLRLSGAFLTILKAATSTNADGSSLEQRATSATRAAHAASDKPKWHQVLRLLDGLRELHIDHWVSHEEPHALEISVKSLPPSLQVLRGKMLDLIGDASVGVTVSAVDVQLEHASPCALHTLEMVDCRLSSPRILASPQLHQLKLISTSCSGGWAAASAAWPNVTELTLYRRNWSHGILEHESNNNIPSILLQEVGAELRSSFQQDMQQLCAGFKKLKSLRIESLHWILSDIVEVVQPTMRPMVRIEVDRRLNSYNDYWWHMLPTPTQNAIAEPEITLFEHCMHLVKQSLRKTLWMWP